MTMTDAEVRHFGITLLTAKTERDKQTRIGASNLAGGCDYCLACGFMGDDRSTPITDRAWMGRILGTALHKVMEDRQTTVAAIRQQYPSAMAEHHVFFADLRGYGKIGGTIDVLIPEERQIIDWKSSTRKKMCLLIDYLQTTQGLEPIYGRKHAEVKLSEKEYADEMAKMAYKVTSYYGQQTLYMHGSVATRAALFFGARNGTGWYDNPAANDYENPVRVHDTFVLSFDYDKAYAEALIARGQAIWDHLEAGGVPSDFTHNPYCFPCSLDSAEEMRERKDFEAVANIDIEATFEVAA